MLSIEETAKQLAEERKANEEILKKGEETDEQWNKAINRNC